jgi:hypothetical protein
MERHLASIVERVCKGVLEIVPANKLEGLVLAGGYGRGEGGVLRTPRGDLPYNDLEFYVFIRGPLLLNQRRFQHPLHEFAEALGPDAGLEVELKVFSVDKLEASEPSMFFYDLIAGHRLVCGEPQLLAGCAHHLSADKIPLHEAARLLMNRCSGLLFAAEHLQRAGFGPEEADFVERNLNKLRLALGDAVLTAFGQYHWSCGERHARLARLKSGFSWDSEVLAEHATGVEFKLHPFKSSASRESLREQHQRLSALAQTVWIWLESRRLRIQFAGPEDYLANVATKCPGNPLWRNLLLNLRCFGTKSLSQIRSLRHPRERVLNALVLLLWSQLSQAQARRVEEELCLPLRVPPRDFTSLVLEYRKVWCQVN